MKITLSATAATAGRVGRRIAGLGGTLLFALALVGPAATAADGVSIAVSPSRLVFAVSPGTTFAQPITVFNQGDEQLDLLFEVGDFLTDDAAGPPRTFAVADWVHVNTPSLTLAPRSQAEVRVVVDVPAGAAPGGYPAGLFIVSAPRGVGEVTVSGRLGAPVLIELPPEDRPLRREIQVVAHDLSVSFPDELSLAALFAPVARTETRVRNVGETFVRAVAFDRYRAWNSDQPVEQPASGATVLRAAEGRFETAAEGLPWFGPASVTTEIVYERGAQDYATIVVQAEAFIIPWRLLGFLVGILGFAWALVVLVRRRVSARASASAPLRD